MEVKFLDNGVVIIDGVKFLLKEKEWKIGRVETNGRVASQISVMYAIITFFIDGDTKLAEIAADSNKRVDIVVKEWDPEQFGQATRTTEFLKCKIISYAEKMEKDVSPSCIVVKVAPQQIKVNTNADFQRA